MADEQLEAPVQQEDPKLSVDEFAAKIKAKYPDYAKIDNNVLTQKILAKYPDYASRVNLNPPKQPVQSNAPQSFTNPGSEQPLYSGITTNPKQQKKLQDNAAHDVAIRTAQTQQQAQQPAERTLNNPVDKSDKKENTSILDDVSNALYLPAFNKGFNDLVVKPFLGASDFVGRTMDKAYQGMTGEKAPSWLVSDNNKSLIGQYSQNFDKAYADRPKPKNIVSEAAEGAVGAAPLIMSLFTGSGESSLVTKAPNFISKATKLLATTGAANAYKDATDENQGYTASLKKAAQGGAEGALSGLTMDAQMLLGGAMGKGVVNKLAEKGLLKGGKAGEALIHALSTATVFGGTPVAQDLLSGKDVDTHEAVKQFGTGLMFEAIPVAKGLNDEIQDRSESKKINDQAAQAATLSTAASNLHSESVLRTLIETPKEQVEQIHQNITAPHEDLYASSIEQGMKAFDATNPNEKRDLLANQLLLKTQGDIKFIASKDNAGLLEEVNKEDNGLSPDQKQDLTDKINILTKPNEQVKPNTEVPAEQQTNETGQASEVTPAVNETNGDNEVVGTSNGYKLKSDADIENRMSELENSMSFTPERAEYSRLEKEMEKRERDSVFSVPLDKASDAIDNLLKKNKDMPNGYGAFIEKRDASESKAVIDRYTTERDKLTERDIKADFKGALMGNPDTWYADGLKLREASNLAAERGININDLLGNIEKEFIDDGFSSKDAKGAIARRLLSLKPINETTENKLTTNLNNNESTINEESGSKKGSQEESGTQSSKSDEKSVAQKGDVKREKIADSDAPEVTELARNLKPKGEPGISVEPSYEKEYGTGKQTDTELENGNKYIVSRDKEGKVNGVLEISYNSKDGEQKEPQAVKVAVDENSRRQGIGTALFKHAEEQGIDLTDVRGKATTDAGQALYEANKTQKESTVNHFKLGDQDEFYHASPVKREGRLREGTAPQFGKGVYFSTNKDLVVNEFGKELTKVNLKIEKPLYTGTKEEGNVLDLAANNWNKENLTYDKEDEVWRDKKGKEVEPVSGSDLGEHLPVTYFSDAAKELGYDAIIDKGSHTYDNEIVVLDESKINYKEDEKPLATLPLAEHSELNNILRAEHDISIKDLKDEQQERNTVGNNTPKANADAKTVQQPENDSNGDAGKNRQGSKTEKSESINSKGQGEGQNKQTDNEVKGKDLSPKAKKATKEQSLTEAETARKLELRKKFLNRLNDVTNIPTLLADKEFREYAGLIFKEALGDFKAFSKEMIDYVGDGIKDHLPALFKELGGKSDNLHADDEKATYGTKNAITEDLQQGLGLPPIEIPKDRTDDESLAAWKDGKRTPQEITEQLLDGNTNIYDKAITPNDEPIMREYIRQLGERGRDLNKIKLHLQEKADGGDEQAKFDIASVTQQINNHLDEYNNALNASKVGGNIWHKYGDERQKAIDDKGLILNSIERIKNIYGKDIPADVKKQLDDLQKRHDELLAKNEQLQAKIKEGVAEQVFERAKSKRTILGTKKLSDVEFKAAKTDILDALKKDWKKSFAKTYATLPGVPQFNALAPHIGKLLKLYTDRGISKLDDVIRNIHDDLKDDIEGITKDDVKDLIAGRYSSSRPLSDLQKQVNELRTQARNKVKIADLEKGIIAKTKAKGEPSAEVKALQKELLELKKKAINEYANLSADELKKQSNTIQKQIDKGDFAKQPIVKRKWESDPEWLKNNRERADLAFKLRKLEQEAMNSKKGKLMRSLDWGNRWGRRVIFFGANAVYTKLSSAAVLGSFVHRLPEQVLGSINAKMFPNIARTAPIEGNMNIRNEGKWYLDFVNPKEFAIDVKDIVLTGETRLSKSMDTHAPGQHVPFLDLFAADGHQIIKSTVKRATFNAAYNYQMDWFQKNGVDVTHPMIIEAARQAAWQRANYEVFQDNPKNQTKIKEYFNQLERSGILNRNKPDGWSKIQGNAQYSAAALYHFFIPINTVPVNILKRVGLGLKLPSTYLEAISKNKSVRDGILNMSHEDSDAILLQLKKGQISAAYWTLGFVLAGSMAGGMYTKFYPNQERDKDAVTPDSDYLNFRGLNVSKDVQHNTQFQALQMGATWNMVHDHYVEDKGESQMMAIFAATAATAGAAAKEHPVISTASNLLDAVQTPGGNTKWVRDLRRRIGIQKAQDAVKLMGYDGFGDDSEDYSTKKK